MGNAQTDPGSADYALFQYSTANIGDEIQSIAARQFLPQVDRSIDRDRVGRESCSLRRLTKLIMNGWYMHGGDWPPTSHYLEPLLLSMHVHKDDLTVAAAFSSRESVRFLTKWAPVGARDLSTLRFFESLGIPAYFSGCLTLTLQRDPMVSRGGFILAVDLSEKAIAHLRSSTAKTVVTWTAHHDPRMSLDDRLVLAEYFLFLVQSAHCVVTTRLHSALPSLALDTPVLLVRTSNTLDPTRFSGLEDLTHNVSEESLLEGLNLYDFDAPPENPTRHLVLRDDLITRGLKFTGKSRLEPLGFSNSAGDEQLVRMLGRALERAYLNSEQVLKLESARDRVERSIAGD